MCSSVNDTVFRLRFPKISLIPGKTGSDSLSQAAFYAEDATTAKSNLKISPENKLFDIGTKRKDCRGQTYGCRLCPGYQKRVNPLWAPAFP